MAQIVSSFQGVPGGGGGLQEPVTLTDVFSFAEESVSAAGTTQGTATPLSASANIHRITAGTNNQGVLLPNPSSGGVHIVATMLGAVVKLYPGVEHTITLLSANIPISVPDRSVVLLVPNGASSWYAYQIPTQGYANGTQYQFTQLAGFNSGIDVAGNPGLKFSFSSQITPPADGQILLRNAAGTDFSRLMFGGTSSSFPSLKRSGALLQLRLADDSAYTAGQASIWQTKSGNSETRFSVSSTYARLVSNMQIEWANVTNDADGTRDVGLARDAAGVLRVSDASTGFGSFISKGVELLLGSGTIDMNDTNDQTIYTAPSSQRVVVTKVVTRDASGAVTSATGSFGWNAGATDVIASAAFSALSGAGKSLRLEADADSAIGAASGTFKYNGNSLEALTATADVFGYFIEL